MRRRRKMARRCSNCWSKPTRRKGGRCPSRTSSERPPRWLEVRDFVNGVITMTVLTANEALQTLLGGVRDQAEIRDANGNVLGYYTPLNQAEELLYQQAAQLFDPTEFERLRKEEHGKGVPFDQVMEHLKALEKAQ